MDIVTSDQFISMLNKGIKEDLESNINFNDKIISIESVGYKDTFDINVDGPNHFFYGNDILTHNSATGAQLDIKSVDNDSVSDSIGTVQTADFIMFLLQNPQMKEENLMTCKITKNRFTGRTDYWDMNIDYTRMKFSDVIVDGHNMNPNTVAPMGMGETEINVELAAIKANDIKIIEQADNAIKEDFDINDILGIK